MFYNEYFLYLIQYFIDKLEKVNKYITDLIKCSMIFNIYII